MVFHGKSYFYSCCNGPTYRVAQPPHAVQPPHVAQPANFVVGKFCNSGMHLIIICIPGKYFDGLNFADA